MLGALVVHVVCPFTTGNALGDWGLFAAAMVALAVVVGVLESMMARLRLLHVPHLLVAASILSVFAILLAR